jgi:hypothetical protein
MRFGERANPPVFRDEALREWMAQDIMHELKTDGGATFSLGRIANSSRLGRRGRPVRGPHPRDIIAQTQTPAAPGASCHSEGGARAWRKEDLPCPPTFR